MSSVKKKDEVNGDRFLTPILNYIKLAATLQGMKILGLK